MRRILAALLILLASATLLFLTGPRVEIDTQVRFDAGVIGDDVEAWLAETEAGFDDIRPGLEKEIIWAYPATKEKTPLSIIYLHGFTASKGEVRPLPDLVASHFGANLFFTRLSGHGRSQQAMGEATVNAWINDLAEALEVGRRIGERVIVLASSTGGSLAAWGAAEPGLMRDVAAIILLSPNFGVPDRGTSLLLLPWGETLARWYLGEERGTKPESEAMQRLWTWRYPVTALLPLTATMKIARAANFEEIRIPALFILSDKDRTVLPQESRAVAARWGAHAEILAIDQSDDPAMHVLAGDASSPSTTDAIATSIIAFIQGRL